MVKEAVQFLVDLGLLEVVLPFILVFTITFGILQRTRILGVEDKQPKRQLNAMVAFVMGFFAVLATNLLKVISTLLSYFVLLMIIALMLALVFGLMGAEIGRGNRLFMAIMIALFALFVFYGLAESGIINKDRFFSTILWPAVVIGTIALVIYFISGRKPAEKKPAAPEKRAAPQAGPGRKVHAEEIPPGGEVEL